MKLFLNLSSSAVMLTLMVLLSLMALRDLCGAKMPRFLPVERPQRTKKHRPWEPWAAAFGGLAVLWGLCFLAWLAQEWKGDGFFSLFYERFTVAGDAPHYLWLAENGYATAGEKINLIVFYPLYPFLMGLLGRVLGGNFALAGFLISQSAFCAASYLLWKLAAGETKHPWRALWTFWLYPQAFFALGVFTEGLFLCLSLGCLYALSRRRFGGAGVWGFFCILCRVQGIALLPAFVYAVWKTWRQTGFRRSMLAVLAIPAGWGVYLLLNYLHTGDFFAFRYYESIRPWWQHTQWLGKTVAQQWEMNLGYPWLGKIIYLPQLFLYFIAAALLFAGLWRGLSTEQVVYGGGYLGMCYLASWLISGCRYMFGCHTLYLSAARFRHKWAWYALIACESVCCAWFYYNFMNGQSIM